MKYDRATVKRWAGDSQWKALRADYARFRAHGYSGWGSEGLWAIAVYRLQKNVNRCKPRWAWAPITFVLYLVKKIFTILTHISIDHEADIGPGLLIPHLGPIRIHGNTKIGADCSIYHGCTIGAGPEPGGAIIGDHVYISCQSTIIGPVKVGDGAMIGSNSLIITDVPAGATAVGVPAKILPGAKRVEALAAVAADDSRESERSSDMK